MTYLELIFSDDELELIKTAWDDGILDWSADYLQPVRSKIRNFYRCLSGDRCCYCLKSFVQDHPLAVDIEHVLPKSKYKSFAISPVNLAIACKRCNMTIKRDRVDFICGSKLFVDGEDVSDSSRYEFIHPNLDRYLDHIRPIAVDVEGCCLRRYVVIDGSRKGDATVKYFLLRDIEEDTLDEIQGLDDFTGAERALMFRIGAGIGKRI